MCRVWSQLQRLHVNRPVQETFNQWRVTGNLPLSWWSGPATGLPGGQGWEGFHDSSPKWVCSRRWEGQKGSVHLEFRPHCQDIQDRTETRGLASLGWSWKGLKWLDILFLLLAKAPYCHHGLACRGQKRASDSLKLELPVVISHAIWVLGPEPWSSAMAARALSGWAVSPDPD